MKNKIVFIVNPKSGVKTKNELIDNIDTIFSANSQPYEIVYTEFAGHGRILAKEYAKQKAYMVVAVGGDGSVNEIATGLVNSSTIMGIIPTGSGNGFAHHFNISEKYKQAIETLVQGNVSKVDTGRINMQHYFFSNCGFAFDAEIAKAFELHPNRGFWTYFKLCLKKYPSYQPPNIFIETNSKSITVSDALLVNVVNTSEFGNNFLVAPGADAQDGMMEILILKKPHLFLLPFTILKFFFKTIRSSRYATYLPITNATIRNLNTIQKDGDWIQEKFDSVEISIEKSALQLIHP